MSFGVKILRPSFPHWRVSRSLLAEDHATIGPYIISYVVICSQGRQIWTYLVQSSTINTGYYQFWIKTSKQAGINLKDRIHNNKAAMALVFKVQMDDEYDKQEIE